MCREPGIYREREHGVLNLTESITKLACVAAIAQINVSNRMAVGMLHPSDQPLD